MTRKIGRMLLLALAVTLIIAGCGESNDNDQTGSLVTGGGTSDAVAVRIGEAGFPSSVTQFRVSVYSTSGQLLGTETVPRGQGDQTVSILGVPRGTAIVRVEALNADGSTQSFYSNQVIVPLATGVLDAPFTSFNVGPAPSPTAVPSPTFPSPAPVASITPLPSPTPAFSPLPVVSPGASPSPGSSPSSSPTGSPTVSPTPLPSPVVPAAITLFTVNAAGNIVSGEGFPNANGSVIATQTHPDGGWTVPGSRITLIQSVVNGSTRTTNSAFRPTISDDGQWTAFESSNSFVSGANGTQLYLYNNFTGQFRLVTSTGAGTPLTGLTFPTGSNAGFGPAVSANGRYVLFYASGNGLPGSSSNSTITQCYRKDTETGEVVLVSSDAQGQPGNLRSFGQLSISADGNLCAFASEATNLVNVTNRRQSIGFVKNVNTGAISVGSFTNQGGTLQADIANFVCLSGDGRYLLFSTAASGGTTWRCEVGTNNTIQLRPNLGAGISNPSFQIDRGWMSGDGRFVVFEDNDRWDPSVTDNNSHCYVTDISSANQTTRVVDVSAGNVVGNGSVSLAPKISRDGRRICFSSTATNLVQLPANVSTAFGLGYIAPNPLP